MISPTETSSCTAETVEHVESTEDGDEISSGDLSIRASESCQRCVYITKPGKWVLEFFLPERGQGLSKDYRVVGLTTGKLPSRRLNIKYKVSCGSEGNLGHILASGEIVVKQTKYREILELDSEGHPLPLKIELTFSTYAVVFPLHFQYNLRNVTANSDENMSIDWLEKRFTELAVDDKLKMGSMLASIYKQGWKPLESSSAMDFDYTPALKELSRSSEFKSKAFKLGLIRPFLLLVSMHPRRRISWAVSLGVRVWRGKGFGNSHWEAFRILTAKRNGIVARVSRTFRESLNPLSFELDWYQICFRVIKTINCSPTDNVKLLFKRERLPDEIQKELLDGKVKSRVSMLYSQADPANVQRLENLFIRQFIGAGNHGKLEEITVQLKDQGVISPDDTIDDETLKTYARSIVESDPELSEKANIMKKHGFDGSAPEDIALAVLSALRKEVMPVDYDHEKNSLVWNKNWNSQVQIMDEEFRKKVEGKMNMEKGRHVTAGTIGTVLPIVLSSLAISPAVVTTIMLSRTAVKLAFPELPASVAAVLSGLIMQRIWLAIADIGIEEYYQ